jgi:7-cyano-7-deazaguanine reductase
MEAIENKYRERDYEVHIRFPEFTCLCPMTAQPDFAEIAIIYVPGEFLVELKSLKLYLNSYRDRGIFHEEAVNVILKDFVEKICPKRVEVTGSFNVRGGIHTTVTAAYPEGCQG